MARKSTAGSRKSVKLIKHTTTYGYDKKSWLDEADRLRQSAKMLRTIRKRRRTSFRRATETNRLRHVRAMEAAAYSSNLLLGYAVELYLKAGATTIYRNCSKELFNKEIKGKYGHNLARLARDIEVNYSADEGKILQALRKIILYEGRYPPLADTQRDHLKMLTERSIKFWSDDRFGQGMKLCNRIRSYVRKIDNDVNKPSSLFGYRVDDDGYFAFRCGGHLRTRITVKYSSKQRKLRSNNKRALRRLIKSQAGNLIIDRLWDAADYRFVKR